MTLKDLIAEGRKLYLRQETDDGMERSIGYDEYIFFKWSTNNIYQLFDAVERMEPALEFYANEKNYEEQTFFIDAVVPYTMDTSHIMNDQGAKAREALNPKEGK